MKKSGSCGDGNGNQHLRCFTGVAFVPGHLFPGYFALVMATGIVSLAAHFLGHEYIA